MVSSFEPDAEIKDVADGISDNVRVGSNRSGFGAKDIIASFPSEYFSHNCNQVFCYSAWSVALIFVVSGFWIWLRAAWVPSSFVPKTKAIEIAKKEPTTPVRSSSCQPKGVFLAPPPPCSTRSMEPMKWMSPCYGENALDISAYESMKANKLRELLRSRKCDYRGTKQQMIKRLVQSYQNELACLTVQQLRPKLRRRKLTLKGSKKDIVRRLVEAGPPE
eukprot:jgi/Psemu1/305733/fgenesh1_kg.215_\